MPNDAIEAIKIVERTKRVLCHIRGIDSDDCLMDLDKVIAALTALPELRRKAEAWDELKQLIELETAWKVELSFFGEKYFCSVAALEGGSQTTGPDYLVEDVEGQTLLEAVTKALAAASEGKFTEGEGV